MKNSKLPAQCKNILNRVDASSKNNWNAKISGDICSNYFTASNYLTAKIGSIFWKTNAVPTFTFTFNVQKFLNYLNVPESSQIPEYSTQSLPQTYNLCKVLESLQFFNFYKFPNLGKCHCL